MLKARKIVCIALVLVMALGVFAACGPKQPDGPAPGEYTGAMVENGNTYADPNWLPVVKNPITVEGIVRDPAYAGNIFEERTIFQDIADKTGVNISLQVAASAEPVQLMFASRNYPDFALRIMAEELQAQAAYAGDIVELTDEMLETYAPNWYSVFVEFPEIYKLTLLPDGKLYNLPYWYMVDHMTNLRDCFWINETWLDELGLEVPETTDDFLVYLRAVKAQAGTGSIPAEAAPMYMRAYLTNIGSYYSIMDWYGVYNGLEYEIVDNGKVVNNAQDPNLKAAVKYIGQLYTEGLLNSNALTCTWAEYLSAIGNDHTTADTPSIGAFFSYDIVDAIKPDYIGVAPLDTGTGIKPLVRATGAANRITDDAFCIFSNSAYPIAILRAFDQYAVGEGVLRGVIGECGEKKNYRQMEDGTYHGNADYWFSNPDDTNSYGWNDYGPGIVTPALVAELERPLPGDPIDTDTRGYLYENIYKHYIPEDKILFPVDAINYLTPDEASEAELIRTKCVNVVSNFMKKWVTGKTAVDDDWDSFQMALKNTGINRRLELLQKAYDLYSEADLG